MTAIFFDADKLIADLISLGDAPAAAAEDAAAAEAALEALCERRGWTLESSSGGRCLAVSVDYDEDLDEGDVLLMAQDAVDAAVEA